MRERKKKEIKLLIKFQEKELIKSSIPKQTHQNSD